MPRSRVLPKTLFKISMTIVLKLLKCQTLSRCSVTWSSNSPLHHFLKLISSPSPFAVVTCNLALTVMLLVYVPSLLHYVLQLHVMDCRSGAGGKSVSTGKSSIHSLTIPSPVAKDGSLPRLLVHTCDCDSLRLLMLVLGYMAVYKLLTNTRLCRSGLSPSPGFPSYRHINSFFPGTTLSAVEWIRTVCQAL